jgi:diguanylate cyclase (GGDEF)-like protein
MPSLRVYRALSRVFPRSFRAKLMAVVLGCITLPLLVLMGWVMLRVTDPQRLYSDALIAICVTLAGTLLALLLIYQLLKPLRLMAQVVEAYQLEHRLPELPEDGRDELGLLMRGINCGLREIDDGIRELQRSALEDPLTGALNRRGSEKALLDCIELAEREDSPLVLYVVDVDNLKPVNDALGHAAGDGMLIDLVARSRGWLGPHDWIGRLGGDEFVLCVHDEMESSNAMVQRWLDALAAPRADGPQVRASAGCARYRPGLDAMQLHREADAAMYRAKASGGGKLVCDDGEHERRAFAAATAGYRAGVDPERRAVART